MRADAAHRAAARASTPPARRTTATAPARQIDARTEGQRQPGYDGFCRDRGLGPGEGGRCGSGRPDEGTTVVVDLIRGEPTFENSLIEDFVIARGDGSPVFLLANVVDDMDMRSAT